MCVCLCGLACLLPSPPTPPRYNRCTNNCPVYSSAIHFATPAYDERSKVLQKGNHSQKVLPLKLSSLPRAASANLSKSRTWEGRGLEISCTWPRCGTGADVTSLVYPTVTLLLVSLLLILIYIDIVSWLFIYYPITIIKCCTV